MGKINYESFLESFDKKLDEYRALHSGFLSCKPGCADCCKKGDYPISTIELNYIMQGYIGLSNEQKQRINENFKLLKPGESCPFLLDNLCSIYPHRPIICRVHGLAYLNKNNIVIAPYCATCGKNYSTVYFNNEFLAEPIKEDLSTQSVLKDFEYGEIKNLYEWKNNI